MLWIPVMWWEWSIFAFTMKMSKSIPPQRISFEWIFSFWNIVLQISLTFYVFYVSVKYWYVSFVSSVVFWLSFSVLGFDFDSLPGGLWYLLLSLQIRGQSEQCDRLKTLKKSEDISDIDYFLVQNPSVEIVTFSVMLQAIQREKPEKYRKLQDASRSAEALVEQMVNGNYMGVALDNLLRNLINEQVHIYHKNYISTYCLNGTLKWYCLIFLLLFLNVISVN